MPHVGAKIVMEYDSRKFFDYITFAMVRAKVFPISRYSEANSILFFHFLYFLNKFLGCLRKHLIFFPNNTHFNFDIRSQWSETKPAVACGIYDFIKTNGIS